jgi:hypothetical protein
MLRTSNLSLCASHSSLSTSFFYNYKPHAWRTCVTHAGSLSSIIVNLTHGGHVSHMRGLFLLYNPPIFP